MRADLKAAIDPSASSVALGMRGSSPSSPDDRPMESAATIPIDLRAVTAAAREAPMAPTSSKVTPMGTEALDESPAGVPRPRRTAGYFVAAMLLAAVGGTAYYELRQKPPASSPVAHDGKTPPTAPTHLALTPPTDTLGPKNVEPQPSHTPTTVVSSVSSAHAVPAHSGAVVAASASAAASANAHPLTSASPPTSAVVAPPPTPSKGPFVRIGQPKNLTGNVNAREVRDALAGAYAKLNGCYTNGIHAGDKPQAFTADLHLRLDPSGSRATMNVPTDLGKSGQCVMNVASDVLATTTENGSADVPIEFVTGN